MSENRPIVKNEISDSKGENSDGFGSRLGYVLATLGMSVGVGAVWRFPMMTGQYGGGAFVLAFAIITIIIVIPAGWAESAFGRKYGKSVVGALSEAAGPKGKFFGYLMSIIPVGLLAYYPAIMATIVMYIFYTLAGAPFLSNVEAFYQQVNNNRMATFLLVIVINLVTAAISTKGIKQGVEKVCKVMLPLMIIFALIVSIRVLTLDGIGVGVAYYLRPDFSMLKDVNLWVAAAGMAIFAVGLGPGFLLTYGSYVDKKSDIATDFITVNIAQLLTCILCGFAIIPAVVLFGLDLNAGKGLLFQSLPLVFSQIPGGMLWFGLFMVALLFAGLSTTISLMELPVASFRDGMNISRNKGILIVLIISTVVSIPCIWNDQFFAFFDNLMGNIGYCISAAGLATYLAWKVGAKKVREEWYNPTSAIKYGAWVDFLYKYVSVPALIYFSVISVISLFK